MSYRFDRVFIQSYIYLQNCLPNSETVQRDTTHSPTHSPTIPWFTFLQQPKSFVKSKEV